MNRISNRNELEFAVFCIENIAARLEIEGGSVFSRTKQKSIASFQRVSKGVEPCRNPLKRAKKAQLVYHKVLKSQE